MQCSSSMAETAAGVSGKAQHGGASAWPGKATKAAVCIMAPYSAWASIQRIRAMHDKSFCRWCVPASQGLHVLAVWEDTLPPLPHQPPPAACRPPHINLLYPFIEDRDVCFEQAAQVAAAALAGLPPFRLTLARLRMFEHSERSCTLWLEPEAPGGWRTRLQAHDWSGFGARLLHGPMPAPCVDAAMNDAPTHPPCTQCSWVSGCKPSPPPCAPTPAPRGRPAAGGPAGGLPGVQRPERRPGARHRRLCAAPVAGPVGLRGGGARSHGAAAGGMAAAGL